LIGPTVSWIHRRSGGGATEQTEKLKVVPGQILGHWEIVKQIGEGGMGVVYLAKDQKLDRLVAIKVLNRKYEQREDNIRRFVQEAKTASALNHPNILTIYEIGELEDSQYIVSEYIEGETLRNKLQMKNSNCPASLISRFRPQVRWRRS
jgi:serine/threonine protein kinase